MPMGVGWKMEAQTRRISKQKKKEKEKVLEVMGRDKLVKIDQENVNIP